MKKTIFAFLLMSLTLTTQAQLKVSVLGDSYSTFDGWIPEGYATWYADYRGNDVKKVEDTWWHKLIEDNGLELELNNSWSGTTICNTGYNGVDDSKRSFLSRTGNLGENPDIIYVFGGTNDDWAGVPLGEENGTDLYTLRPAVKAMFKDIKANYPEALCVAIINSELRGEVVEAIKEGCNAEGVPYIQLVAIDKQINHPSVNGMQQIAKQVWKGTAPLLYKKMQKK